MYDEQRPFGGFRGNGWKMYYYRVKNCNFGAKVAFFKGKRAFASIVFPQPGGPYIKTPLYIHSITGIQKQNLMFFETFKLGEWFLGGSIPMALYMFMCVRGSSTASRISFFHVFKQSLIGSKISNFDSIG